MDRVINKDAPKEGEFYKRVEICGHTFELYYGYYEDCDRESPLCEPIPIYPDLIKYPIYTKEGFPIVTKMQDACDLYDGDEIKTSDTTCADCKYFKQEKDWFGACACIKRKK